jgi:hypothetical protein
MNKNILYFNHRQMANRCYEFEFERIDANQHYWMLDFGKKRLCLHLAHILKSSSSFCSLFHDFEYVLKFRIGGGAQQFKKNHFRAGNMSACTFDRVYSDLAVFLRA